MTEENIPNIEPTAAQVTEPDPVEKEDPSTVSKTYTEEQYQRAIARKLANYVPKTEYQKALERAESLEKSAAELQAECQALRSKISAYELEELKRKIGKEVGLPDVWIEELRGIDEKSLREHAASLREKLGMKTKIGSPVPPVQPSSEPSENDVMNNLILQMARGGYTGR
jgi:hypothetical protein